MTEKKTVERIKTKAFERRLALAAVGLKSGSRAAGKYMSAAFLSKDKRQEKQQQLAAEEAQYIADELGKLKGSVVKIGQVMAMYGSYLLPEEVTLALRSLEEDTIAVAWPLIEQQLQQQLGARYDELDIDPEPIGAASLAQVHKATVKSSGQVLALKVQYPGVAESIDSDLKAVINLLKISRVLKVGPESNAWIEEIHTMLHNEVNYHLEAEKMVSFSALLADDERYIVPQYIAQYSTQAVLAMSYESGLAVNDPLLTALPLDQRNALACAFVELFFKEVYCWSKLQTDPNFGNYRIRLNAEKPTEPQIVLLDFGAVQDYPDSFIQPLRKMMTGALLHKRAMIIEGAIGLNMMQADFPEAVLQEFATLCELIVEPLNFDASTLTDEVARRALDDEGRYCWANSGLPKRAAKQAAKAAMSKHFLLPPKEFTFLSRKLLGIYGFVAALKPQVNMREKVLPLLT